MTRDEFGPMGLSAPGIWKDVALPLVGTTPPGRLGDTGNEEGDLNRFVGEWRTEDSGLVEYKVSERVFEVDGER
jgi:hypothetical protein